MSLAMRITDAMMLRDEAARLEARLRAACRRGGLRLPRSIRMGLGDGKATVWHADAYASATGWNKNGDGPHPDLIAAAERVARRVAAMANRRRLFEELGQQRFAPAWTILAHPLALWMRMQDEDGAGNRLRDFDMHIVSRHKGLHDYTRMMLYVDGDSNEVEHVYTALPSSDGAMRGVQWTMRTRLSETVAMATMGRRLGDVVEIAPTGRHDVDRAVDELVITDVETHPVSTVFTFAAARWLTSEPAPPEWVGWDDAAPMHE